MIRLSFLLSNGCCIIWVATMVAILIISLQIVKALGETQLSILRLDPFLNISYAYRMSIKVDSPVLSIAMQACDELYSDPSEGWERLRCVTLTAQRIRDEKLSILRASLPQRGGSKSVRSVHEGEVFGLMYGYHEPIDTNVHCVPDDPEPKTETESNVEDTIADADPEQQEGVRVCVFGEALHISSFITIVSATQVSSVWIFINSPEDLPDEIEHTILHQYATHYKVTLSFHVGDEEAFFTSYYSMSMPPAFEEGGRGTRAYREAAVQSFCDILHATNVPWERIKELSRAVSGVSSTTTMPSSLANCATAGGASVASQCPLSRVTLVTRLPVVVWVQEFDVVMPAKAGTSAWGIELKYEIPGGVEHREDATLLSFEPTNPNTIQHSTLRQESGSLELDIMWSALWPKISSIEAKMCMDGFTGRHFAFDTTATKYTMREVLYGRVSLHCPPQNNTNTNTPLGWPVRDASQSHQRDEATAGSMRGSGESAEGSEHMSTIVITFTLRVFAETAFGLRSVLRRIGYRRVFIVPDLTTATYSALVNFDTSVYGGGAEDTRCFDGDRGNKCRKSGGEYGYIKGCSSGGGAGRHVLQIALGPHDLSVLLRHYVVFQMEQTWSAFCLQIRLHDERTLRSGAGSRAVHILLFLPAC